MIGSVVTDMWDKQSIIEDNKKYILKFPCTDDSPLVSIVLVNHNGEGHLKRLFESLRISDFYKKYELIVVEQVSTDGSMKVIDEYKKTLPLRVLINKSNESFSIASNKGVKLAKGEYVLLLNNDTEVTDGWLDVMLEMAMRGNVGAVGARLIYPEMPVKSINAGRSWTIQHKGVLWGRQCEAGKSWYIPYHQGRGTCPVLEDNSPKQYGVVTAACLMVKKSIYWEVGGLDETYLWGYEDVDFCLKIYRHGYDNYFCPTALLFHYEFGTQKKDGVAEISRRRMRNRIYLYERWSGWLEKHILQDKIEKKKIFTEARLKICLIADADNASYSEAEQFNNALLAAGYISFMVDVDSEKAYYPDKDVDVIISLVPHYNPLNIKGTSPSLLTFAWCANRLMDWCNNEMMPYFNYVLVKDDCTCELVYERTGRLAYRFDGDCHVFLDILKARMMQDENKVLILSPAHDEERGNTWGDHHFAKDLARGFQKLGYSTEVRAFDTWELPFSGKYVVSIRGSILPRPFHPKMEYINIMWNISHPEALSKTYYDEFDKIFVASRIYAEILQKHLKMPVVPLMQCTSPEKFYKTKTLRHHELLFVGDALGRFRKTIKDLLPTEYEFSLYGREWERYLPREYIKGHYLANEELKNYYSSCDILLNDHWPEMREKGFLSNRLFDGLAAGAFVITDNVEGLEIDLPEGVVAYDGTREDLQAKVDYWMKHPAKRRRDAEKGRKLVEAKHTFYNRAKEMIDFMKQFRFR